MRAGINALTIAFVVGVIAGLALTPDGRAWMRHPTLLLGERAAASASPPAATVETRPAVTAPTPAPEPASPPAPSIVPIAPPAAVAPRPARQGPLRIGVFGDSMAEGLHTGLYRALHRKPVTVSKFSQVSTGLSRYDYVDVQAKTREAMDRHPLDVAVVLFGANDAQAIETGGQVHAFGSDGWKAAYARRIDDLVGLLRSRGVTVYWVGLPKMRRDSFDARMTLINGVVSARMRALGVPWIETRALTSDADGEYAAYLPDAGGRRVLMRANDGIHMSLSGYRRISAPVADRVMRDAGLDL